MILPSTQTHGTSLMFVEGGLTLVAVVLAFGFPKIGSPLFAWLEDKFTRLARRKRVAVAFIGLAEFALRLAILPLIPIPQPIVPDDFSFLLSAETFASGRLTNPTPAMWMHFETMHVSMTPTYMSMYFPAQGLLLAAGKLLFGNPWFGLLAITSLMCAAICWMLQAWMPPRWALLGGIIALLHLGLFSYWINTFHAGSIGALGGALVLGAMPRFLRRLQLRYGVVLAAGMIILAISRPYEGVLLCVPVAIVVLRRLFFGASRPSAALLMRSTALPMAMIIVAGSWMAYYDYRAFGNPMTPPYTINRAAYAVAPYYVWQSQRPDPGYHHTVMREFYYKNELPGYTDLHKLNMFLPLTLLKGIRGLLFFSGLILLVPLGMAHRVFRDRRMRFLMIVVLVMTAGLTIEIFLIPHYLAPFTAAFYAIGLQAMRHLRVKKIAGQPVGLGLTRLIVVSCLCMCTLRLFAAPLHFALEEWPASEWNFKWYGPGIFGQERAQLKARLQQMPGKQLIVVRYSAKHNSMDEWVYNSPDIDASKVVWAREMDASQDEALIHYYKDRHVWLLQPDSDPTTLQPYPVPASWKQQPEATNEQANVAVR